MGISYHVMQGPPMKKLILIPCFAVLSAMLCACASRGPFDTANAAGYYAGEPVQCVPYARDKSGLPIRGDAYTWWEQAAQQGYVRGPQPMPGAVLVLKKTQKLNSGHLAVVRSVVDARHIDVTHSNWGSDKDTRSAIYKRMRVEDVSDANDWSLLRFWNKDEKVYGFPYPAYGFIYPYRAGPGGA